MVLLPAPAWGSHPVCCLHNLFQENNPDFGLSSLVFRVSQAALNAAQQVYLGGKCIHTSPRINGISNLGWLKLRPNPLRQHSARVRNAFCSQTAGIKFWLHSVPGGWLWANQYTYLCLSFHVCKIMVLKSTYTSNFFPIFSCFQTLGSSVMDTANIFFKIQHSGFQMPLHYVDKEILWKS